jgi:anti-sigma regulatory factor (Ser/Thr protein kinase)
MGEKLVVVVPCVLRFRDPVGALIQQVCQQLPGHGADQTLGFQVVSAFNEAFNNLCQYAYPDGRGDIEVRIEILEEALVIELCDEGETYNYEEVSVPDLTDIPESGLGIFIIRSFMSEVAYSPGATAGAKNVLRMVRQLAATTAS